MNRTPAVALGATVVMRFPPCALDRRR